MRKDLGMRKGKMVAQGAHASIAFLSKKVRKGEKLNKAEKEWIDNSFTKICVYVNSEEELDAIVEKAQQAGINVDLIIDAGRTEFHGVPTKTCAGIGPAEDSEIDKITGGLKLL